MTIIPYWSFRYSVLTSIAFPHSIKTIEKEAFRNAKALETVILNEGLEKIDWAAFSGSGIKTIHIPSSVQTVGTELFSSSSLERFDIPSGWSAIPYATFSNCKSLRNIVIPVNILTIEKWAFLNCSALEYIRIESVTPPVITGIEVFKDSSCPIYVPSYSLDIYKAAINWSNYASRIQAIPDE